MLPAIKSSSEVYGTVHTSQLLREVPVAGILGDQQAATFGQAAFEAGEAKNTYGTGNFLIFNTGEEIVHSKNGLLTTVGYKLGDAATALRAGGIDRRHGLAHPVAARQPGHDQQRPRGGDARRVGRRTTAASTSCRRSPDSSRRTGARMPAARIVGLTRFVNKGHIARAALEATAFQTREVLDAVNADSGVPLTELKVDGGMVANDALMQFQADILGVPVIRPKVVETTALGAAYAAGLAVGFWKDLGELRANWSEDKRWEPNHGRRRARPAAAALEEGRHEDHRLGRRGREVGPRLAGERGPPCLHEEGGPCPARPRLLPDTRKLVSGPSQPGAHRGAHHTRARGRLLVPLLAHHRVVSKPTQPLGSTGRGQGCAKVGVCVRSFCLASRPVSRTNTDYRAAAPPCRGAFVCPGRPSRHAAGDQTVVTGQRS